MEAIRLRKKHVSTIMKDVIICCRHSDNFFIEMNGMLIDKSCHFFAKRIAIFLLKCILLLVLDVLIIFNKIQ